MFEFILSYELLLGRSSQHNLEAIASHQLEM